MVCSTFVIKFRSFRNRFKPTLMLLMNVCLTAGVSQCLRGPNGSFPPSHVEIQDFMYNINTLGTNVFAISSASDERKNTAVLIAGSPLAHESSSGSTSGTSSVHPSTPLIIGVTYE